MLELMRRFCSHIKSSQKMDCRSTALTNAARKVIGLIIADKQFPVADKVMKKPKCMSGIGYKSDTIPFCKSDHEQAVMTAPLQRPYLASYCMIRANDTILVQRRFNTGYLDGHWALPSGHVVDDEDALAAASRELLEETSLIVEPDDWQFVCAMHRRTDRTIVDLFFTTDRFLGTPRICEPTKCDGLAFYPMNALPQPLASYIGVALDCLRGTNPRHGPYHGEGWS